MTGKGFKFNSSLFIPLFYFFYFIILSNNTYAQELIFGEEYNISVYEDPSCKLTLEDIYTDSYQNNFINKDHQRLDFGLSSSTYWIRIDIQNKRKIDNVLFTVDYALIQELDLFCKDEANIYYKRASGLYIPYPNREIDTRNIAFKINSKFLDTIYIRCKSIAPLKVPIKLVSQDVYYSEESKNMSIFSIYYGIVTMIILINIFYFFYLKDTIFIKYSLALFFVAFGLATDSGLAFKILWPSTPELNLYSNIWMTGLSNFFMILFIRNLLLSKVYAPIADRILLLMQWTHIIMNVILPFFAFTKFTLLIAGGLTLLGFPLFTIVGVKALILNYKPAKFYLIGWAGLCLGVMMYILWLFSIISINIGAYGIYAGSTLESLFFMISIAIRYKVLQQREIEYKKKIEAYQKNVLDQSGQNDNLSTLNSNLKIMEGLSKRETEVLEKMIIGLPDKEIAEQLFISVTTVKTHARNIYSKLGVKNRTEASALVNKYNLVAIRKL